MIDDEACVSTRSNGRRIFFVYIELEMMTNSLIKLMIQKQRASERKTQPYFN